MRAKASLNKHVARKQGQAAEKLERCSFYLCLPSTASGGGAWPPGCAPGQVYRASHGCQICLLCSPGRW